MSQRSGSVLSHDSCQPSVITVRDYIQREMVFSTDGSAKLGDSIQDYEVFNFLGKGGFAEVYRARSKLNGLEVAIKMVDKGVLRRTGVSSTRVQQEVAIHSRLKHPAVVELYNYFEDRQYVYLVVEYCPGGELQSYLKSRKGPLSEPEASHVLAQVVSGLLYLHSHNILHRDLSLSNLLLTRDLDVKIGDFGLATQLKNPWERHTTLCGTPNFMSPEVASQSPHGLEADVWSLGVMLHTFLLGRPPPHNWAACSIELPSSLSPAARHLLCQLLQRNPQRRIPLRSIPEQAFMKQHGQPLRPLSCTVEPPKKPLNTVGLRPASLWARNMKLSILEDGEVCIEFLSTDQTMVGRVLRVSADGTQVLLYRPPVDRASSSLDGPPAPVPAGCRPRPWNALPRPYWPKYACAARFVALVRQKTPKIIFYADSALCILLGSGDFEVSFYSGSKVVHGGEQVKFTEASGHEQQLTMPVDASLLTPAQADLWKLTCEYHRRCVALESALEATDEGWNIYPAVFGRRPQSWQKPAGTKSVGSCCFSKDYGSALSPLGNLGSCFTGGGTCMSTPTMPQQSLTRMNRFL
ncbi:polo like kinase SAK [Amblyomma americanum]